MVRRVQNYFSKLVPPRLERHNAISNTSQSRELTEQEIQNFMNQLILRQYPQQNPRQNSQRNSQQNPQQNPRRNSRRNPGQNSRRNSQQNPR